MVRARFKLNSITIDQHAHRPRNSDGTLDYDPKKIEMVEQRTFNFTPVQDGSPEAQAFWDASPSGSLQLGVINEEAWAFWKIGHEYYLDFTPVPAGA